MTSDFLYKNGTYPAQNLNQAKVRAATKRLHTKLSGLALDNVGISDYNRRYFGSHIKCDDVLRGHLTKYGYILEWALSGIKKDVNDLVLLDYGGGHGMLSLLAKESGVGTVIHNDIYPVSCLDAEKIGIDLSLQADHYVPGDINRVVEFCKGQNINCDVVANYDVIEHIYDIHDFLGKLNSLSDGPMSIFLASAANELNPRIKRILQKQHNEFEYQDRSEKFGRKPTDATRAILNIRREIITSYAPSLPVAAIDRLSLLTRGLMKHDIEAAVDSFKATGKYPDPIRHPTNTCDPYTGNWFEHLMDPYQLAHQLTRSGFSASVKCGYYDSAGSAFKASFKGVLNAFITNLGGQGLRIAPYYALFATK